MKVYGSRSLSEAFINEDIQAGRYKARQLMKKMGLKPRYPKRFKVTIDSDHNEAISSNILNRKFDVALPNKIWKTDITYVWTLEGWLYVAAVIDLFSMQVVGWSINDHIRTSLCVNALQMAFWRRKPEPSLHHHSDRGSHMQVRNIENTWD
jgi:transposase InsO family protein